MKPKHFIVYFLALLFSMNAKSQSVIALDHNGLSTFFTDVQVAVNNAVSGDIIYLPGGSFPGFNVDKKLTIIGAGFSPDSTIATTRTIITGDIVMINGDCDGCVFTGLRVNGSIFSSNGSDNDNVQVSRCFVTLGIYPYSFPDSENWVISECYVRDIGNLSNSFVTNNLITSYTSNLSNCQIENNIFFYENIGFPPITGNLCSVKNNIFLYLNYSSFTSNSIFYNNIFSSSGVPNGLFGDGNIGVGNIYDLDFNGLFENLLPGSFDNLYLSDLHLVNSAYNTGGTDGSPIGIYGGLHPWKAGSVPFNPHFQNSTISSTTNAQGSLNVQIKAAAQEH